MPPRLASLLTWGFIVWLFRRDNREKPNVTGALWLPLLWVVIICSRAPSQWLDMFGVHGLAASSVEEGGAFDASVYFGLIAAGFCVLAKRRVNLSEVVRNNRWLTVFLLYCFLAVLWSDYPFVSFKRWFKILGDPIMVLVIVTEPDPLEALIRLMKRCAYVLIPVSVLFFKYYPEWGRSYSQWTGVVQKCGIATSKNPLGYICLIFGFFFFWHFLNTWKLERSKARRDELILSAGFLCMIGWLEWGLSAQTSLVSFGISASIVALASFPRVNKRFIGAFVLACAMVLLIAQLTFGFFDEAVGFLGRDTTLTGRTDMWQELLQWDINPAFGAGFESFWLGDRLRIMGERHWWRPNQAHNGYLETYLNLGLVGLFLLIGLIFATYRKSSRELHSNPEWGRFRFGFLAAVIILNWTDAAFKILNPIWFVFCIIAIDYPASDFDLHPRSIESSNEEEELEFAPAGKSG